MEILGNFEEAEPLAKKSKWILVYYIVYGILGIYFIIGSAFVFFNNISNLSINYIVFLIMFPIGLVFCYISYKGLSTFHYTPAVPIKIDNEYLYIYSKRKWNIIPRTIIRKVRTLNFTVGSGDGSDGSVIIMTKKDKYVVRHIKNTGEVKIKIVKG